MDDDLLTKIFIGAFSSLFLMLVGPRIIRIFNPKEKKEIINQARPRVTNIQKDSGIISTVDSKSTLLELKNDGVIDDLEYSVKLKSIELKEDELRKARYAEELDRRVMLQIEPLVAKLADLLSAGVITNEEFELKKEKLYSDQKKSLIENPYPIKEFNHLQDWEKRTIRDLYIKRNEGDTYWFKRGTNNYISLSKSMVDDLKARGEISNYFFILLPANFNPNKIK
jgi:hypothetical protein